MKTITQPNFCFGLLYSVFVGAFAVTWSLSDRLPLWSGITEQVSRPAVSAPQQLPFSFQDVVRHFEAGLGPAQEKSNVQAAFRGGSQMEHFYEIIVSRLGSDLLVRFQVNDDYGMNQVREFFEASFFEWRESEQFYALLDGRSGSRALAMPRFQVLFEHQARADMTTISMMFTPRFRTLSATESAVPAATPH